MEIEVPIQIKKHVMVKIHIEEIILSIEELEPVKRWNVVAMVINSVSPDVDKLPEEQRAIVAHYLETQLNRFKK